MRLFCFEELVSEAQKLKKRVELAPEFTLETEN